MNSIDRLPATYEGAEGSRAEVRARRMWAKARLSGWNGGAPPKTGMGSVCSVISPGCGGCGTRWWRGSWKERNPHEWPWGCLLRSGDVYAKVFTRFALSKQDYPDDRKDLRICEAASPGELQEDCSGAQHGYTEHEPRNPHLRHVALVTGSRQPHGPSVPVSWEWV